ncbi:hypothetical protein M2105_004294 [Paenibacillus sp. PastF-1]|nr:hypothetical protein [Paenibacillus sp. PastF-2]MDF9849661.1 hypothetical protein [Paenibacillus sp. PastM-2]MDF9856421.1 hypothetical protein [Paenibacillus sp. PastF-1]MDH6481693.1 hypothetical protein [Paenibacillus sp. PastH-2]MDH6508974.1 hypothetical protein [Paenibacillus sp. PastM-3]
MAKIHLAVVSKLEQKLSGLKVQVEQLREERQSPVI